MAITGDFRALCLNDEGKPRNKPDCRAEIINHLILEELLDVDEAEERTEDILNELDLWSYEEPSEELGTPEKET
jgi:hypothetical protein